MAVGSGLAGSVGIAAESAFATYVAPTRFLEVNSAALKENKNVVQGGGLAAGRFVRPASRRLVTHRDGAGDLNLEVVNKGGLGLLLAAIFGGAVTPAQQGATTAYLQTHTLVDNVGRFLSIQEGLPDAAGTVRPYTFLGCKLTEGEFSCGVDEELMLKASFDSWGLDESKTLAAPSYPTGVRPFHFAQMGVKIGASVGSEVAVDGVSKVSVSVARGQKVDRFYANAAGRKREPLMNDWAAITGSLDTDFVDKTLFADRFSADTPFSLIWEFVGAAIGSSGYSDTFRLKLPACYLDTDTPTLDGPDVLSPSFNFTALNDLTNAPITCEYISADTAL